MENVKWEYQKWFDDLFEKYRSRGKPTGTGWGWGYLEEN
jgi:hypothetical protein